MAEQSTAHSRRAVMGAGIGALVGVVAHALARPNSVRANGENVVVGSVLATGSASTGVATTVGNGLQGTTSDVNSSGVFGRNNANGVGIAGSSGSGAGAGGSSDSGIGVFGFSRTGPGVEGQTDNGAASVGIGVIGHGRFGGTGVLGFSEDRDPARPAPPQGTGVWGYAVTGTNPRGVTGQTTFGRGVDGVATVGTAVYGKATSGEGVHAESDGSNGVSGKSASNIASGVYGENTGGGYGVAAKSASGVGVSANTSSGIAVNALAKLGGTGVAATSIGGVALQVTGRTTFSTAGLTTVAVGASNKVVIPGTDISAASIVLCTLESNQAGLAVQRVVKNVNTDRFTVYLTRAVASGKSAKLAWFVIR